jgi:hypothetical protein
LKKKNLRAEEGCRGMLRSRAFLGKGVNGTSGI